MLKQAAGNLGANRVADAAFVASRQVWLAGLGAVIVTREWARNDAGHVLRALIKEGASVEARAIRLIGQRFESSILVASTAWIRARDVARATVGGVIDTAAATLPRFTERMLGKRTTKPAARKARPAAKRSVARKYRRSKRSA